MWLAHKWLYYSLLLLKNDAGIKGLESFDYCTMASLIERVKEEVNQAMTYLTNSVWVSIIIS